MLLVRFLQSIIVLSLVGIVVVLFQAGAAATGQVIFTADHRQPGQSAALNFDNSTDLKLFQADLQSGKPDYYSFRASKGTVLQARLNTLRLPGQDNFRPFLALFGPGLPAPLETERNQLPFSLPSNAGLLLSAPSTSDINSEVKTGQVAANEVEDGWTQTSYWERQTLLNEIPQDGTYFLAVFSPTDQTGKYALAVGDKAQPGLREILTFPVTWTRLHLRFGELAGPLLVGAVGAVGLLIGLGSYLRLLGRQLRLVNRSTANRRRNILLRKRVHRRTMARKNYRPIRPATPLRYRPAIPARLDVSTGILTSTSPVEPPLVTVASQEVDSSLLVGPRWELLTELTPLLPVPHSNGNGHHRAGSETGNGHSPTPTPTDGLRAWGQLYRPQTAASDASPKS